MPGGRDRRDMEIRGGWKVKEGVSEMEKGNRREREREEVIPPCHALYT